MKRCYCLFPAVAMMQAATYVNPAQCAGCHAEIAATYASTGMARSFATFKPPVEVDSYYHEPSQSYFAMVEHGGRYYLTFDIIASKDQFRGAYPQWSEFFALKRKYDPDEMFSSVFYQKYAR